MVSASGLRPPAPVQAKCGINCSICKAPSGLSIRDPFPALFGASASVSVRLVAFANAHAEGLI